MYLKTGDIKMFIKKGPSMSGNLILASQNTKPTTGFVRPTAQYSKKFGGIITSTGTLFKTKDTSARPEGFDWLGTSKSMKLTNTPTLQTGDIPKPFKFNTFSEYFAKDFDPKNFDIVKTSTGSITQINAKPVEYISGMYGQTKGGYRKDKSTYVPYEAVFTPEGNLIKEVKRDIYTDYERQGSGSKYRRENTPFEQDIKTYKDNALVMQEKWGLDTKDYGNKVTKSPVRTNVLDFITGIETINPTRDIDKRVQPIKPLANTQTYSMDGRQYQYDTAGNKRYLDTGQVVGTVQQGYNAPLQVYIDKQGNQYPTSNPNFVPDNKTSKLVFNRRVMR